MRPAQVAVAAVMALALPGTAVAAPPTTTPADQLWSAWSFQPLVIAGALTAIAFFFQGFRRLRRRGRPDLAGWDRAVLFVTGVLIVTLGLVSPLDAIAESYLQSAHMLQHTLIADLGIALTLVAVRGPLSVFFLPRGLLVALARSERLRRSLRWIFRPPVALTFWILVLVVWHLPALYEGALHNQWVHDLEHLSFVCAGLVIWTLLIDPSRHGRLTMNERIGLAIVVFWTGQLLAYVFVFSFNPFYSTYADQPTRLLGLSPLMDQKLAGLVMMAEQGLTLGVCLFFLVRASQRRARPRGRAPLPEKQPA